MPSSSATSVADMAAPVSSDTIRIRKGFANARSGTSPSLSQDRLGLCSPDHRRVNAGRPEPRTHVLELATQLLEGATRLLELATRGGWLAGGFGAGLAG